ncbi:MAG TPA: hypothetical protein VGB05_01545, partial [Pyrinomonadaceae bacterium]
MTTLRDQAHLRHSDYYKGILIQATKLYLKGDQHAEEGLSLFDREWSNINAGQRWVAEHIDKIEALAQSGFEYADAGSHILSFRFAPRELIRWQEDALA